MFSLNESNSYQVYGTGVDMRKGVLPLCGIIRGSSLNPTDGSVYVFMNRTRRLMKLLHWERGGYVIYYKRMEQGRLSRKMFPGKGKAGFYSMRWDELLLYMEGIYHRQPDENALIYNRLFNNFWFAYVRKNAAFVS